MSSNSTKPEPTMEHRQDAGKLVDFLVGTTGTRIYFELSPELKKENVSFEQYLFLNYLTSIGEMTMTDIANKMGFSTASATEMVDKLEKYKLVQRQHSQVDRRKILVSITSKGQKLVHAVRQNIIQTLHGWLNEKS